MSGRRSARKKTKPEKKENATKRERSTDDKNGILLRVSAIESVEHCDKPGLHIATSNTIRQVCGVEYTMNMRNKKITIVFETEDGDKVTIEKAGGGIGIMNSTGGTITMNL